MARAFECYSHKQKLSDIGHTSACVTAMKRGAMRLPMRKTYYQDPTRPTSVSSLQFADGEGRMKEEDVEVLGCGRAMMDIPLP